MKNEFIALIILFLLVSCQSRQQVTENISTIDSILQVNVTSLLENKLSELDALSGQETNKNNIINAINSFFITLE